jgi:IS605 OrfB family transposase
MTRYTNNTDTSYTLSFEKNKQVRIILSFEAERIIPENKFKLIGIDVNSKHNLLQCSNGDYIDFDRDLIKCLSKELLKIDKLKSKNQNYVIGKRKDKIINHLIRELQSKIREQMALLCKRLNTLGINHVVLENLTGFQRKAICKDENKLNYNRRLAILKLSSLKNEFEHIARKYDIAISFVHPCYTSITCPKCGCIDKSNRKTQEIFKCVECNFTDNADVNAAKNILNRVVSTELRDKLLKKSKLGNGTFEPKDLSKDDVKKILLSLRYSSLYRNKESGL